MSNTDTPSAELQQLRSKIDDIDNNLLKLISERAECAMEVAEVKRRQAGEGETVQYYRPEREAQLLRSIVKKNSGPIDSDAITQVFREIISACRALEEPLKVVFLGPQATFTEAAAIKHFGQAIEARPLESIEEVFREVESGAAKYGVVPIENSTEGMVNSTLDCISNSSLQLCGEVWLRIHQNLLSKHSGELSSIKTVYAHDQSLAQCRRWLGNNLPGAECKAVGSNAAGARLVAESDQNNIAALAGDRAAVTYGLTILAENIEDESNNTTRFFVIGKEELEPSGQDKTSLLIAVRNEAGALHRLLEPLAKAGVELTRIDSRPSRESLWDYVFFVDLEGHRSDKKIAGVISEIENMSLATRILGSYPVAIV